MRILVADLPDSMAPDPDYEIQLLTQGLPGADVVHHRYDPTRHDEFVAELAQADALLTGFLPIPREVMDAAPRLRCISMNATGYDNVDLDAAKERGIAVMCIGEYCTEDVAEHTVAVALALNKDLRGYARQVEDDHRWAYARTPVPVRFVDQVFGIIGLGRIGMNTATKVRALGLRVLACDPFVAPDKGSDIGVELVSRDEVLRHADIISNHMNANDTNQGYFNAEVFGLMKRHPIFINTARGSAVVEDDLIVALDSGQIRAAGVDVLVDEHPDLADHPLLGRSNVILTPHSAFYSTASMEALMRVSCMNIVHYLHGREDQLFKRVA